MIAAKQNWLERHLPSVQFDEICFVPYDFIKNSVNDGNDILFDDEARHLTAWTGKAYHATEIFSVLKALK